MFLVLYPANLAWIHKNGGVLDRGIYYILIYIYIYLLFLYTYIPFKFVHFGVSIFVRSPGVE